MKKLLILVSCCLMMAVPSMAQSGRDIAVRTVPLDSISLSDPYILPDPMTRMYYMTGSGGMLWKSEDLVMWTGPYKMIETPKDSWMTDTPGIWAAELHYYKGKYYCFLTFSNPKIIVEKIPGRYDVQRRASHVLVADKAEGPYHLMNNDLYLPENWSTIDGTFWVEDGVPYMVFVHEWMQIVDGTMDMIQLKPDLSGSVGKSKVLFKASDAHWAREMHSIGEITFGMDLDGYVTDGPELFRTQTGKLGMLWSSWGSTKYAQGVAYSKSGKLEGPWEQEYFAIVPNNSGHGMLFRTFEGKLLMVIHHTSFRKPQGRRPLFLEVDDSGDKLMIGGRYYPKAK